MSPPAKKPEPPKPRLVWDSAVGATCHGCNHPQDSCRCGPPEAPAPIDPSAHTLRISRDRKQRGGKEVTRVEGIPLPLDELQKLAKQLKRRCGTGGKVTAGLLEIQGDQRKLLAAEFAALGYRIKHVGG